MRAFHDARLDALAALAILVGIVFGFRPMPIDRLPQRAAPATGDAAPSETAGVSLALREEIVAPVLVYHHITPDADGPPGVRPYEVTPEEFEAHMALIEELGYQTVTVRDLLDAFGGTEGFPEKPIVLTFDDGRENQHLYAFPLLLARGFVGTVYPFTNAIGRPGYLTAAQLREFQAAGFEIGSHTRYHPYLTKETDADLEDELVLSKRVLEELLGEEVRSIAWPFGLVDARVTAAAEAAGYAGGRGLTHGAIQRAEDRMDLRAFIATGSLDALRRVLVE